MQLNTILQGDTIQILKSIPDNLIDLGITSPPYNKGEKQKGWLVGNVLYENSTDNKSEEDYQTEQIKMLNEMYRITKEGGSFFYNHKTRWDNGVMSHPIQWLLKSDWVVRQEIIWDRGIAANIRGWRFWQIDERIYWLYKPVKNKTVGVELQSKHALLTSIWKISPERNNPHPAPFPIEIPTRIIHSITNEENSVVLDPYAGSGTTLVAAKLLGKSYIGIDISKEYIGIDISKEYIDMANQRLQQSEKELSKVNNELSKHAVNKTFKQRKENGEYTGKHKK